MRRRKPMPAGDFPAEIVDLNHLGRGVARVDGKATFIADALPGEQVQFRYVQMGKDADEGQCVAVERASPHRVEPRCAHFGLCGGCSMQHLDPPQQVTFKQKQMLDQLARIGKVQPAEVAAPVVGVGADAVWGYRRRARLGVKLVPKKGGVLVGFRERSSHFLAALDSCVVLDPRVGQKLRVIGAMIETLSIANRIPQIEIACANTVALVFRVLDPPTEADCARLLAFGEAQGFSIYLQTGGPNTIRPLSDDAPALCYSPDGSELSLQFEPTDFIQVNGAISQQTVNQALDWLDLQSGDRVLELFCGLGNFSLPLARRGARVIAVEGEDGLVRRARANAARNRLDVRFEKADLFTTGADVDWLRDDFDKVLLDPPRAGAREILPIVAARKPSHIVYVSCHPGTLARDAGMLVHEHGYRLVRAGVMDMFPHTGHVESMALFVRGV
ncbi:23S rRNA (uracil(1939)-C(5))-methyltransferase RlmD [Sinimarinibacterium sp. CAU 1509]|uniref:23S rRNA (uracil(1939)-C(5))-methyltransferase RlmD n=1 Tax=Sinimarinibacterium sp. CAU 1509 TaxID=2562283 RepID=UPI0010AC9871|nr:23S rRNA (uracil(1939)-C(5))-methyltransferase RlmD [Sinimarinibacterium sp. CAU 1509]TJY63058.1 23S rRNA (uracil(1939)-C(5))-methyltransferase RlmD [Sinimarinibacterium sp. CAU 1509]